MRPQLPRLAAVTLGLCAVTTMGLAPVATADPGHGAQARHDHAQADQLSRSDRSARSVTAPRTVPSTGGPVTANPSYTGAGGYSIGVDSKRGLVYMIDGSGSQMTVYHEATRAATKVAVPSGVYADTVAVDEGTGYVYVPSGSSNQITVLRAGELAGSVTLPASSFTYDVAVDSVRHLAYVTGGSKVYVLRGADLVATVPVGDGAYTPVVNPTNGLVYVPTYVDGNVSVIKGTEVVATVDVGDHAAQSAFDPLSGLVYVTTYGGTVSVLQGTRTEPVATLRTGGTETYAVAANPETHLVYVTDDSDQTVTVIRGTRIVKTLHVPVAYDGAVAVNPVTGLVLVAGSEVGGVNGVGAVTAIRGTKVVSTTPVSENTYQPAFDTRTGRAFVTADNSLLDLQTPTVSTVTVLRPQQSHVYRRGARAVARYSCTAGTNNVLRSCHAWIKNGGKLATTRLGRHSFTVTARSAYGTAVRTTVHYRVRR